MADLELAEVFPPGDFILEALEERGWNQLDLAEIIGRTPAVVNELVKAKRAVTPDTARELAQAFGTTPNFWMNIETRWQLWKGRGAEDSSISRRAALYRKAPVKDMIRRGWIEGSTNVDVVEKQVLEFFGKDNLEEEFSFSHAARKSATTYGAATASQCAWLFRARQLATMVDVKRPWRKSNFRGLVMELKKLTQYVEEIRHVPRAMADYGVRFVVVEPLPSSKIDGACFWLDDNSPVVALSIRFDRVDNFWHTTMHELGHVQNQDSLSVDVDIQTQREDKPDAEKAADTFAVETLVPQEDLNDFCVRVAPLYSRKRIRQFSALHHVHPGIVVGQLHYRPDGISYTHLRDMLEKIREIIVGTSLTDGWGHTLQMMI